jgi:hypothetical protein
MAASLIAIALQSNAAMAQAQFPDFVKVPPMPSNLQVPPGHVAYLKGRAAGTQNYICQATNTGFAWRFLGPQATLFFTFHWFNVEFAQQITTHYLSPNPVEAGTPRATWQSSIDTSAVWARAIASSVDTQYVEPGAIPWLLLEAVGTQKGPTGGTMLTGTTYIQRLNTSGGSAPATGCSQATEVGALVFVPYTTDYFFYKQK